MENALEVILDVIKTSIPALIVYFTVSKLMKDYLDNQYKKEVLDNKTKNSEVVMPMRLQAYERLSLFCERISIPALILRLNKKNMNVATLKYSMLVTIQSEFEHNISQQIYISNNLWQIIKIAKEDIVETIAVAAEKTTGEADSTEFNNLIYAILQERGATPLDHAILAIKKEASTNF